MKYRYLIGFSVGGVKSKDPWIHRYIFFKSHTNNLQMASELLNSLWESIDELWEWPEDARKEPKGRTEKFNEDYHDDLNFTSVLYGNFKLVKSPITDNYESAISELQDTHNAHWVFAIVCTPVDGMKFVICDPHNYFFDWHMDDLPEMDDIPDEEIPKKRKRQRRRSVQKM